MLLLEDKSTYDGVTDETPLTSVDNMQSVCMCLSRHRQPKNKNSVLDVASEAPEAVGGRHVPSVGGNTNHRGDKPLGTSVKGFLD